MSEHTKMPWHFTAANNGIGHVSSQPDGYGDIATVWNKEGNALTNAAFIVKSVNHHYDLLACVRAALNMVDGDGAPPDWDFLRRTLASVDKP